MNKHQLLEKLDRAWAELHDAYAGLSEAHLVQPGVTGEWSVTDILAHVTTWEEEALKALPLILDGTRPPRYKDLYGGIDAFNALRTEEKRGLAPAQVLSQLEDTHRRLVAYVATVPEDQFTRETPFRRRLRLDTYGHYPIHARAVREWRERGGFDETV